MFDRLTDPEELGKIPVEGTGGKLRLTDVTTVVEDHQPLIGDAIVNDADGLLLVVEKFPGANTLEVTQGVEEALADLGPGLGGMEPDTSIFRPAAFIENAIDNLTLASLIAGVLLALILSAFLFEWRTVLIGLITIPLSLVAAALVLDVLGETFNAMSFAGLAVAVAVIVDAAVAGAENVARRLRQEREFGGEADGGRRPGCHARGAQPAHVRDFHRAPCHRAGRCHGRPAGCVLRAARARLRARGRHGDGGRDDGRAGARPAPVLARIGRATRVAAAHATRPPLRRGTRRIMRRPRAVLAAGGACLVGAVVLLAVLPLLGTSLIPSFKDRDLLVRLNAEPGTSNTRMTEIATQVSRELRSITESPTLAPTSGGRSPVTGSSTSTPPTSW